MADTVMNIELFVNENNAEEGCIDLLKVIRPPWQRTDISFQIFTEGITNRLLCCHLSSDIERDDAVIVRIYGHKTETMIDRDAEIRNMKLLHSRGLGAKLYAVFSNGLVYQYLQGTVLDGDMVKDPHIANLIAKQLVKLHKIPKSDLLAFGIENKDIFEKMRGWLSQVQDNFPDPATNDRFKRECLSKNQLLEEIKLLEGRLKALNSPIVFSHGDLLIKNIIYDPKQDVVHFIDYEYAMPNYEAFDIGFHFDEYAGVEVIDFSLYPDREYQLKWLRNYLGHKFEAEGRSPRDVTEKDVETLYVQANQFALLAHLYCAIWSLIQTVHSTIDFDFLGYGITRLNEYIAKKDIFLGLKIPE